MQIVGKPEKPKSREPLILLGLRLVIQVVLPLGSGGTPVQVQVLSPAPITKESLTWLFCYFMRKVFGLEPSLKRYSPTTVALPRESTFLNEGFKIYFKTEIASEIVFSKASRPYLSTSALFFSPWVRQPAPPIHPPTHAIPSIKFA